MQSGNDDVEGCRSQKVLFQPNMRVFLQCKIIKGQFQQSQERGGSGYKNQTTDKIKSLQSTLSHLITTSVPNAMFTHFLVKHGLSQYYLY